MHYIYLLAKIITIYWAPLFLTSAIILTIYILKWPLIRDVKINIFTYIGALIYISFYILFFIGLRWVQINKEIDIKKFTDGMENFLYIYNKSFFNQVFYTLLIILLVLLWVYIFIKLREKLSYQVWKIYFYYRYKYLLNDCKNTKITKPHNKHGKILKIFEEYLSFYIICYKITCFLASLADIFKLSKFNAWLENLRNIQCLIKVISISLIFIFIFYDCYFNNFVLSSIKYYLFFYMIFSLWYKISKFFREEASFIDKIIFERTYCAPNVVYINLTQEEYEFLNEYLKDPNVVTLEFLATFIWATPPVAYHKRFVYTEVEDIFNLSEKGFTSIPYNYVYQNKKTQRYFPAAWLKGKDGKYYTDQEL